MATILGRFIIASLLWASAAIPVEVLGALTYMGQATQRSRYRARLCTELPARSPDVDVLDNSAGTGCRVARLTRRCGCAMVTFSDIGYMRISQSRLLHNCQKAPSRLTCVFVHH